ncbi:MAG: RNA polymerase sigma factor [Clostridia bacterium]|nr:RNA polymerase sigma factor [Clostridia bacterium]
MENGDCSYRRFLDGDNSAFDGIVKEHFDHVVFFIDRILHDTQASEDVAIDVFAYLAFKKGYDGRSSMRTYLLTVARSRALNYIKKHRAHPTVSFDDLSSEACDRADMLDRLIDDERKKYVSEAMDKLPDDQKTALHLVFFEGLTYKETAKIMKKSEKQVDNLLFRAKNALRSLFGEEGRKYL